MELTCCLLCGLEAYVLRIAFRVRLGCNMLCYYVLLISTLCCWFCLTAVLAECALVYEEIVRRNIFHSGVVISQLHVMPVYTYASLMI